MAKAFAKFVMFSGVIFLLVYLITDLYIRSYWDVAR